MRRKVFCFPLLANQIRKPPKFGVFFSGEKIKPKLRETVLPPPWAILGWSVCLAWFFLSFFPLLCPPPFCWMVIRRLDSNLPGRPTVHFWFLQSSKPAPGSVSTRSEQLEIASFFATIPGFLFPPSLLAPRPPAPACTLQNKNKFLFFSFQKSNIKSPGLSLPPFLSCSKIFLSFSPLSFLP